MTANIWVVVGLISMLAVCYPIAIVVGCGSKAIPKMMMKVAICNKNFGTRMIGHAHGFARKLKVRILFKVAPSGS